MPRWKASSLRSKPSEQHARRIGCVTKPRLTCSITSNASTMLNVDTRQSATKAPCSSRCRRGLVKRVSTKPGAGHYGESRGYTGEIGLALSVVMGRRECGEYLELK